MILYDVNSFPYGLSLDVWIDLIERKGIILYASDQKCEQPVFAGNKFEKIALIDMSNMEPSDIETLEKYIIERDDEDKKKRDEQLNAVRENNNKLINYLHDINK